MVSGRSSPGYSQGNVFYSDEQNALVALPIDSKGKVKGQPHVVAGLVGLYPSTYWVRLLPQRDTDLRSRHGSAELATDLV